MPCEHGRKRDVARWDDHPSDDPTLRATPVHYTSRHVAIGLNLVCETNDERLHAAALSSFGPQVAESDPVDVRMRIFVQHVDDDPGWLPRQPLVREYGDIVTIVAGRATAIAGHFPTGEVTGFVSERAASQPEFLRVALVQSIFLRIAQARALAPAHAACLTRDGRTLLLRGTSGAGKSTLCFAALQRGFHLVAEDIVFLRVPDDARSGSLNACSIRVHGMPWNLHLLPDAPILFPELANIAPVERVNGEWKIAIDVPTWFPGQVDDVVALGPHVFVERSTVNGPRLTLLSCDDALARFAATAIMHEAAVARDRGLWDAFLQHPAYLLEVGPDPHQNVRLLDEALR